MKLLTVSLFALFFPAAVQSQGTGQPECAEWTQAQIYVPNQDLQDAEDSYLESVKAVIEANCFSGPDPTTCEVGLSTDDEEANEFMSLCYSSGGRIWTYTYSPLCGGDINSSDQTDVEPVMVCASASCASIGVQNLIPQSELAILNNITCAVATNNLEMMAIPDKTSEPECQNWTTAQLFDPNPAMKPAEDAYLERVATALQSNCIDSSTNMATACDVTLDNSDAVGQAYYDECTANGGKMYSYTLTPQCNQVPGTTVQPVLVCASASCTIAGIANLYPRQVEIYKYFDAIGITCGSATDNLEEYTPSGGDSGSDNGDSSGGDDGGSSGGNPVMACSWLGATLLLVTINLSKM